jgi:multiple sugar transport system permease protein
MPNMMNNELPVKASPGNADAPVNDKDKKCGFPSRNRGLTLARRRAIFAYGLLMPAVLLVAALIVYPMISAVRLSLIEGRFASDKTVKDVSYGLSQFADLFANSETWLALGRSMVYVAGTICPSFLLGLVLGLLLQYKFFGRRFFRTMLLMPWAVPGVAVSAVFLLMLDAATGIVNKLLVGIGIMHEPVAFYANASTALAAVIVPTAWKTYPFFTIVIVAALQMVPQELYEAVRIDGGGRLAQFRYVTWPGIRGAAGIAFLISGLGAFREFDLIFPLTRGGPSGATSTLAIAIYQEAFQYSNMGYAAALGIFTTLIAAIVVVGGSLSGRLRAARQRSVNK